MLQAAYSSARGGSGAGGDQRDREVHGAEDPGWKTETQPGEVRRECRPVGSDYHLGGAALLCVCWLC